MAHDPNGGNQQDYQRDRAETGQRLSDFSGTQSSNSLIINGIKCFFSGKANWSSAPYLQNVANLRPLSCGGTVLNFAQTRL
jgi:hypothetical protein